MQTARKFLAGFIVLALSIAIPASISAAWFVYVLWIAIGLAVVVLIALSGTLQRLIPWTIERKRPEIDAATLDIVGLSVLRRDLRGALQNVNAMDNPSIGELRPLADNLSERRRNEGYAAMAARVELHLLDDAERAAVERRRQPIRDELVKALIWDNYN